MPEIPRDRSVESTLALLRDPYGFVGKRYRRYGADLFEARLLPALPRIHFVMRNVRFIE